MPRLGRLPEDIPITADRVYGNKGWNGWGDWLGTGSVASRLKQFRPFREARTFARKLKLKNQTEWFAFCRGEMPQLGKPPDDFPAHPQNTYADKGWKGWGDWLGTGSLASTLREFCPFGEARAFAHKLKLKSRNEWSAFYKGKMPQLGECPENIPIGPDQTYAARGWKGWGDWLGTGNVAPRLKKYRPFSEARAFARKLKLRSWNEWRAFCKGKMPKKGALPPEISASPHKTYANKGWKGVGDWLGTGTIAPNLRKYRTFGEARTFSQKLRLKNQTEWFDFSKGKMPQLGRLPEDIPACPNKTYVHHGWQGWGDWLGTGRTQKPFARKRQ